MRRRPPAATKLPDSTTCRNTFMLVSVSTCAVYRLGRCSLLCLSNGVLGQSFRGRQQE
jgi:hypothetical protein